MKPIPLNVETETLARRMVWFEPSADAWADPIRFMAYVTTYATPADLAVICRYVSDQEFREALDEAPAGIIDPCSWTYWNAKMGRYLAPPMPIRKFR